MSLMSDICVPCTSGACCADMECLAEWFLEPPPLFLQSDAYHLVVAWARSTLLCLEDHCWPQTSPHRSSPVDL